MEQRKLIKLGNSSFAIALPKDWIDRSGLKKGDNIFLERNRNGEILVSSSPVPERLKEIKINVDSKNESILWQEISNAYMNGFNHFYFNGEKIKEFKNSIKKITKGFLGLEIIKNADNEMIIKDFFDIQEINQENFIRRIENNIGEMINLLIEKIKKESISQSDIKEIEEIDWDINKFYALNSRLLFMSIDNPNILTTLKTNSSSIFNNWWISSNLESLGDDIKYFAKILKDSKFNEKEKKELINILENVKKFYEKSSESINKKNKEEAIKSISEGKEIWDKCNKIINENNFRLIRIASKIKDIEYSIYKNTKIVLYGNQNE